MTPQVSLVLAHFHITDTEQHFNLDCYHKRNGGNELTAKAKRSYAAIYRSLSAEERLNAHFACGANRLGANIPAVDGPFASSEDLALALGASPEEAKSQHAKLERLAGATLKPVKDKCSALSLNNVEAK